MIYVIGIGPGAEQYLTIHAAAVLQRVSVVIGNARQLEHFMDLPATKRLLDSSLSELTQWLKIHQHSETIAVLASGDPLINGIGHYLSETLGRDQVEILSGISSIQYLFAQIKRNMNECYITSSHGRTPDFEFILQHDKVAMVTDSVTGPYEIAQEIINRGLSRTLIIGENLSYNNERIEKYRAEEVLQRDYQMNVVVIINE